MASWVVKSVAALVLVVAVTAVGLGLAKPDGVVGGGEATSTASDDASAADAGPSPTPAPTSDAVPADPTALSPVTGTWPGRPAGTPEAGGVVDWCPAVQVQVSPAARSAVGEEAARAAACSAVAFTFDVRYSRLSLPREAFTNDDFADVVAVLSDRARASTYPARIDAVVASPRSAAAREGTGVVLLDGPAPGRGRQFFGPAWSAAGYTDRPVWVDPVWSVVEVDLQRGGDRPLLTARLEASAGVPIWNPAAATTEKLTVPTTATYVLAGPDWRVNGWTLRTEPARLDTFD